MNIDFITKQGVSGEVARQLMNNGQLNPDTMRPYINSNGEPEYLVYKGSGSKALPENYMKVPATYGTLRRDEWKRLDEAVLMIAEDRLTGVQDLIEKGLTYDLGNGMGTTVLEWHDISDALEADLTMDAITRGKNDRPNFQTNYLPIPIIHADYEINTRQLNASRNLGNPLDTTMAERAVRKVTERLENMLFTNTTYAFGEKDDRSRNAIYSYINHPDRIEQTLSVAWDASAKAPKDILKEVLDMKQNMIDHKMYGKYALYIPTSYETVLDEDYEDGGSTARGLSIRQRLEAIQGLDTIKVVDTLPADNVVMVRMNRETVRLVRGMPIQNVQWSEEGKMINKYKVMTIQVPQIRSDQNGNCGVVHLA